MVLWSDTKATPASRFITADIQLFGLAASILMVIEERRRNVRLVWAYIVGGVLFGMSTSFPLFLLARELRINKAEASRLRTTDTVLLTLFAVAILAMTIWIVAGSELIWVRVAARVQTHLGPWSDDSPRGVV